MLVSIVVIAVTSVPLIFLNGADDQNPDIKDTSLWVYPLVAIQGVGIAIMLNTATSLISDVIGTDSENSAFVYGCYSLFDKFANGLLLFWLVKAYSEDGNAEALRYIMGVTPVICSILSYFMTYIG